LTLEELFMATPNQTLVSNVLQDLKLELLPAEGDVVGGPQRLKVTDEAVAQILSLKGKTLLVGSDGNVTQE
jgi:hypothetical protein